LTSVYTITRFTENYIKMVYVPLTNSNKKVVMYEKDFDMLLRLGVRLPFKIADGRVVVRSNGRNINVSRLIFDAKAGQKVGPLDGDHLNLRRNNLVLAIGRRTNSAARDMIVTPIRPRKYELRYVNQYIKERTCG
jgi:hypothetical protein